MSGYFTHQKTWTSRRQALMALGQVVYAVRLDGGVIKIGCTAKLDDRLRTLRAYTGSTEIELLGFASGDFDDEAALHSALVEHRHHGREYYHPAPEVLAVVNEMREGIGLAPVA